MYLQHPHATTSRLSGSEQQPPEVRGTCAQSTGWLLNKTRQSGTGDWTSHTLLLRRLVAMGVLEANSVQRLLQLSLHLL
jgi:hypothetical protein